MLIAHSPAVDPGGDADTGLAPVVDDVGPAVAQPARASTIATLTILPRMVRLPVDIYRTLKVQFNSLPENLS
jgi:hypothetical protein